MKKEKKVESQAARRGKNSDSASVIMDLFRTLPDKRYTVKNLAAAIGLSDRVGRSIAQEIVDSMIAEGSVEETAQGKYRLKVDYGQSYDGIVDMLASGSMYVKVDELPQDVYISQRNSSNALNGDRVRVTVLRRNPKGAAEGEIIDVLERSKKAYVGVAQVSGSYAFVKVDSRKVPQDIYVSLKDNPELKDGQKVRIRIVDWAKGSKSPTGEIVDVFGMAGDNDAEMHAILAEYDLPYKFDEEVEKAADAISGKITKEDIAQRRDVRGITTFTIDPADAKDFDDALSIRSIGEGKWEIGVHIADVTHYVDVGSIVDTEGESRATSVYLVDRTVPMLPEVLSNNLCSLNPNEEKLTFSAIFEIDDDANVLKTWIGRTIMISDRRFTYEEAQQIIEGGDGDFKDEVLTLNKVARILRANRFKDGSIGFDRDEAKFQLDEKGHPLGVYFKEMKESNQLIEEFMLLANKTVAEFAGKKRGAGANAERTFVYRVHDKPDIDKLASFGRFITKFGYTFKVDDSRAVAKEMNRLMGEAKGKVEENVIATLAVRTMAKAYYSTDNIGHYGLSFDFYTHFTSPIRRYPDMMVHRLLAHYLAGGSSLSKEYYEGLCEHSSSMEVRAAEAERASIKYKMVEFMLDKVDQEFDGHISGVTEWGIYVELDQTHIEGMAALRDMTDDFYSYDDENYAVVGQATGRVLTLGDAVRIKVLRADLARKQLDFLLTGVIDFKTGAVDQIEQRINDKSPRNRNDSNDRRGKSKGLNSRGRKK